MCNGFTVLKTSPSLSGGSDTCPQQKTFGPSTGVRYSGGALRDDNGIRIAMPTMRMNFRIDSEVKDAAEAVASELGLSLSSVITLTFKQMARDRALPFLPTAGVGEELRNGAPAGKSKDTYGANYVDGYDTSRWIDVERIKNLAGDDLFDPIFGKQALWDAKNQWDKSKTDPAKVLREYGYRVLELVSMPRPDPFVG